MLFCMTLTFLLAEALLPSVSCSIGIILTSYCSSESNWSSWILSSSDCSIWSCMIVRGGGLRWLNSDLDPWSLFLVFSSNELNDWSLSYSEVVTWITVGVLFDPIVILLCFWRLCYNCVFYFVTSFATLFRYLISCMRFTMSISYRYASIPFSKWMYDLVLLQGLQKQFFKAFLQLSVKQSKKSILIGLTSPLLNLSDSSANVFLLDLTYRLFLG